MDATTTANNTTICAADANASSSSSPPRTPTRNNNTKALTKTASSTKTEASTPLFPPRMGRKGDPRMHKAVAARLAEPTLTLFHALQIGGFDYPTDEDASCLDSENVTLGQRKNQLSRRIRLAKRQQQSATAAKSGKNSNNKAKTKPKLSLEAAELSEIESDDGQHQQQLNNINNSAHNNSNMPMEEGDAQALLAKFHPQFRQFAALRNAAAVAAAGNQESTDLAALLQPRAIAPGATLANAALTAASGSNASHDHHHHHHHHDHGGSLQQQPINPTALEQLALNIQNSQSMVTAAAGTTNTTNRSQPLQSHQHQHPQPHQSRQQELALQLYHAENKSLYQKCMLLAGYPPQDSGEGSTALLEFSLVAWQSEGKRLEMLLAQREEQEQQSKLASNNNTDHASASQLLGTGSCHSHDANNNNTNIALASTTATTDSMKVLTKATTDQLAAAAAAVGAQQQKCLHMTGQCKHKPVLHQPRGGNAHIDFLVGDKVECYHQSEGVLPQPHDDPKVLGLDQLSLDEWNFDLSDEGIMGLVRLASNDSSMNRL